MSGMFVVLWSITGKIFTTIEISYEIMSLTKISAITTILRVKLNHRQDLHTNETTDYEWFRNGHENNYFYFISTFSLFTSKCFSFLTVYSLEYRFEQFWNIFERIAKVGLLTLRQTCWVSSAVFSICRSCNQGTSGSTVVRIFNHLPTYSKSNGLVLQKDF